MANKNEVTSTNNSDASLVVNNAFIDGLTKQLDEKVKYGLTFPKDYSYANELMGAYLILKGTKDKNDKCVLQSCSQASIANTLMFMVTKGLSMQKGQCYPVAYGGKLQCQVSVYGNTCIARRFGLKNISAMCIYADDVFKYEIHDAEIEIAEHNQDFMNIDPTKIIGAYAVAALTDGTKHIELMNIAQIKMAWRQGYGYKENGSGTHQKFTDQMCMKTVKNRCLKYIIRTYGTESLTDYTSDETSYNEMIEEDVKYDIDTNANTVDFAPDEEPSVVEVVETEAEVIEVEDGELPPFMKEE